MAVICITGGNGMIGKQLTDSFTKNGHEVIILTRRPQKDPRPLVIQMKWDISSGFIDPEALVRTEVIIHLAGSAGTDLTTGKFFLKTCPITRIF